MFAIESHELLTYSGKHTQFLVSTICLPKSWSIRPAGHVIFCIPYTLLWFELSHSCKGSYCGTLDPRALHYWGVIDHENVLTLLKDKLLMNLQLNGLLGAGLWLELPGHEASSFALPHPPQPNSLHFPGPQCWVQVTTGWNLWNQEPKWIFHSLSCSLQGFLHSNKRLIDRRAQFPWQHWLPNYLHLLQPTVFI